MSLAAPQTASEARPISTPERRILVVEDSEVIRRVLSLLLQREGYAVLTTDRGCDVLDLARRERPAAVTLDLALGDADGREVLRRLKQDAGTRQIPIVILSAFSEALAAADRWYAADVIAKPFDVDDLLRRVARVVCRTPEDHPPGQHRTDRT